MPKVNKKEFEGFSQNEMVLIDGRSVKIGENFLATDFFPSKDRKDVFVKYEGLSRVARKLFTILEYVPSVIQSPAKSNDWCAVVSVVYILVAPENINRIKVGSAADCRSNTAAQGFGSYTTAMAETRAKARALREILGLPMCSVEEVSDEADVIDKSLEDPIENQQIMLIEKKYFQQLGRTMEDVVELIGRKVSSLDELTKGEGGKVIGTIGNKEV